MGHSAIIDNFYNVSVTVLHTIALHSCPEHPILVMKEKLFSYSEPSSLPLIDTYATKYVPPWDAITDAKHEVPGEFLLFPNRKLSL